MKRLRYIFAFVFLAGMLFTTLRYLPILEEETPTHRVEMAKKDKTGSSSNGADSNDDDDNDEGTDDLYFHHEYHYASTLASEHLFYIQQHFYSFPEAGVLTPPPKI